VDVRGGSGGGGGIFNMPETLPSRGNTFGSSQLRIADIINEAFSRISSPQLS